MTYVGPPVVWQFDKVVSGTGLFYNKAAAQIDNKIFYYAPEGFHVLIDGSSSRPIGYGRVDEWFKKRVDKLRGAPWINSAIDSFRHIVYWTVDNNTHNVFLLAYDYQRDKWGMLDTGSSDRRVVWPYKWGGIAEPETGGPAWIWTISKSEDSDVFLVNTPLATASPNSVVGSQFAELSHNRNSLVTAVIPGRSSVETVNSGGTSFIAASSTTICKGVGYTDWRTDTGATASATSTGTAGALVRRFSTRKNGRYHKFFVQWDTNVPNQEDIVSYVDVEYAESHRR
jgi:hypothetical protein